MFESEFESEQVFRDFRSSSLSSFFRNFQKFRKKTISEISEHSENPVSELSEVFPKFSKLFDPKTGFFDSKTQNLHTFFEIFKIYIQFWIISKLFSKLKFPNFFPNFFAKILRVRKFRFFQKISELRQPNISETRKNEKFGKFRLTQGLNLKQELMAFVQ